MHGRVACTNAPILLVPLFSGLGHRTNRLQRTARLRLSCIHAFLAGSRSPATLCPSTRRAASTSQVAISSVVAERWCLLINCSVRLSIPRGCSANGTRISFGEIPEKQSHVALRIGYPHHACQTSIVHRSPLPLPGFGRLAASNSRECAGCSSTPPHLRSISAQQRP